MTEVEDSSFQIPEPVSRVYEYIKLFICFCVVMVLIIVVFAGIALEYCVLKIPPIANFILLFLALTLLAYVEALHYSVIAIEKWDMEQYREKYPRAVKCQKLVDTPVKVKKFIVGRQFFVIFVVFLIAQITSFPDIPKDFAGLPSTLVLVLLETGLPGIAIVLTFGQLISQLFVEEFTMQFMNLYGCEFCIRLSLGAEYIGICNFSWLLFHGSSRLFCSNVRQAKRIIKQRKSSEQLMALADVPPTPTSSTKATEDVEGGAEGGAADPNDIDRGCHFETGINQKVPLNWFDYLKYLWSTFATGCSVGIILYGISIKAYVLPTDVAGAYIIAFLMMINLFFLEGLMIAIVGTQYWDPETFKDAYPRAYKVHKLVNKPQNVKRFIIGRQFFTVLTNFLLAQIFTFAKFENPGWDPVLFYIVIKSGLVGVLTILAFAQLMPELLAAEYPLRFMNMYYSYTTVWISLVLDFVGVGHAAWAIYFSSTYLLCKGHVHANEANAEKPEFLRVESAEMLAHEIEMASGKRKSSFSFLGGGDSSAKSPSGKKDQDPTGSPSSVSYTGLKEDESLGLDLTQQEESRAI